MENIKSETKIMLIRYISFSSKLSEDTKYARVVYGNVIFNII